MTKFIECPELDDIFERPSRPRQIQRRNEKPPVALQHEREWKPNDAIWRLVGLRLELCCVTHVTQEGIPYILGNDGRIELPDDSWKYIGRFDRLWWFPFVRVFRQAK